MKKRMLAVLLTAAMMATLVAGCGKAASETETTKEGESTAASGETTAAAEGEAITFPLAETKNFSMLCVINGNTPMEEVDAFKYLNEQSNITFDVDSIPMEDAAEKEGLILSAGDYPDTFIFSSLKKDAIDKYGTEGVFIPLEDYIKEYAPNLTKLLDESDLWSYITAPDGHVYEMPGLNTGAELEAVHHTWLNIVCGHKWADLSENNYGVSLLNDCKYGYGIKDNVMGLSLLKSAKSPDTEADMGAHTFTYALLPHSGGLGQETMTQGIRLNQPAVVTKGAVKEQVGQLFKKSGDAVKMDAIKMAEDGDGLIIHLHESTGGKASIELSSDYRIKAYAASNLPEEYSEKIEDNVIKMDFEPFEIKCFRVWMEYL